MDGRQLMLRRSADRLSNFRQIRSTAAWQDYRSAKLYDACSWGEVKCVNRLLSEGTDPDWLNPERGLTPLHIATMHGRAACVLSLLHAGADIYAKGALPHSCNALDLFGFDAKWFRVADRLFGSRDYKACHSYLLKADADIRALSEYQGIVVIHPGGEAGLVSERVCRVDTVLAEIDRVVAQM